MIDEKICIDGGHHDMQKVMHTKRDTGLFSEGDLSATI